VPKFPKHEYTTQAAQTHASDATHVCQHAVLLLIVQNEAEGLLSRATAAGGCGGCRRCSRGACARHQACNIEVQTWCMV